MTTIYDKIAESYIGAAKEVATLYPKPTPATQYPFAQYFRDQMPREERRFGEEEEEEKPPLPPRPSRISPLGIDYTIRSPSLPAGYGQPATVTLMPDFEIVGTEFKLRSEDYKIYYEKKEVGRVKADTGEFAFDDPGFLWKAWVPSLWDRLYLSQSGQVPPEAFSGTPLKVQREFADLLYNPIQIGETTIPSPATILSLIGLVGTLGITGYTLGTGAWQQFHLLWQSRVADKTAKGLEAGWQASPASKIFAPNTTQYKDAQGMWKLYNSPVPKGEAAGAYQQAAINAMKQSISSDQVFREGIVKWLQGAAGPTTPTGAPAQPFLAAPTVAAAAAAAAPVTPVTATALVGLPPAVAQAINTLATRIATGTLPVTQITPEFLIQQIPALTKTPSLNIQLKDLGHTAKAISAMKPEEAWANLFKAPIARPAVPAPPTPAMPAITPAISKKIALAHNTTGGASFDITGKNLVGTDAFAVGVQTEGATFLPKEKITVADVTAFARKNAAVLSQPQHIIGTWFDKETGKSVLVVSVLRPDIESAVGLAQQQGHLEIYDLKTQERLVTTRRIISPFSEIKPFDFDTAIDKAPKQPFLTRYSQEELGGFKLFLSQDKLVGFAIKPDGDLINIFNASAVKGAGEEAVVQAIVHGATKLDAMDVPFLRYYYEDAGFRVMNRDTWNEAYAPKDWDYEKFGRPDIIYMEYQGGRNAVDIRASFRAARVRRLSAELRGKMPPARPVTALGERERRAVPGAIIPPGEEPVKGLVGVHPELVAPPGMPPTVPPEITKPPVAPPPTAPPPAAITPPPPPVGPPPPAEEMMADLQNFEEMAGIAFKPDVWRAIGNLPAIRSLMNVFGPAATANTPAAQAVVGRAMLRHEGQQKTQGVISYLNRLGTQEEAFGKLDDKGLIAQGPLKGLSVNTIRTYPKKYTKKMTPAQREWVEQANVIEQAKLAFLKRNEIEIKELTFEEGGQYAGRRVFAKVKVTQGEPEVLETGYVGAGPGRPGAKLAAEKHRIFKTEEEAIVAGFRYLPEDEALYLNVAGAYNRVADKQMADWLLFRVPWRTTAAPEELKLASYVAKQKLNKSRVLRAALNRAVRGERVPTVTINSIARAFPDQAEKLRALIPRIQAKEPTGPEVQALKREADALIKTSQLEWYKARSATARARELAMRPRYGEAMIPAPAFAGKIITGPEAKAVAKTVRDAMAPGFNKALDAVNKINAVARFFMLAGDLSPMTIQLLLFIGAYPEIYGKAGAGLIKAIFDPEFHANYLAKHNATIQASRNLILTKSGATEFTEAMARGGLLSPQRKLLPAEEALLKKGLLLIPRGAARAGAIALQPFQRAFEASLDVAGIELREALDYMCTTPERTAGVEQFINEFRGLTSSSRIGVSVAERQRETAGVLAPRYNRAIAGLLFDLFRGTIRGGLARKSMAKGVAALVALAVVISYAMGEDTEEVVEHLNPTSPMFMTWQIAGQKVGPGSKVRSVIKLFGQSAKDPEKLLELSMDNPGLRWIRGNFSPVISTGYDLLTGRDYIGDPTRDGMLSFTEAVGKRFMPIWTQSVVLEGGTIGERAVRGLAEFTGMRGYPDPWGKLADMRETEAMSRHNKSYEDLNRLQQKEINEVPEIKELQEQSEAESARRATGFRGEVDDFFAQGDRIEAYRSEKLWEIHNQLTRGAITPGAANSAYWELGKEIGGMYEARDRDPRYDKVREYLEERATEKEKEEEGKEVFPGDKAYYEYQKLFEQADAEGWSSEVISQRIEMLWRQYPGAEQYVTQLQEVGKDWPPSYLVYRRTRGNGEPAFQPARMPPVGAGAISFPSGTFQSSRILPYKVGQ